MRFFLLLLCFGFLFSCKKHIKDVNDTPVNCLNTQFFSIPSYESLWSVYFVNGHTGFVGGYSGGIYRTTDSAKTWTQLNSGITTPVLGICFINPLKGFAVGGLNSCGGTGCIPAGGYISRTLDGGQTWTTIYTPTERVAISSIYFINDRIGFCAGMTTIFKTINGGDTWTAYKIPNLGGQMMQIRFLNDRVGYVACMFDKIVKTTDAGNTWNVISPHQDQGYYAVSGSTNAIYLSGQKRMIKSTDGGNSWQELPNSPYDIYDLHFNGKRGFAVGRGNYSGGDFGHSYGSIYCTGDGGNTWMGSSEIKDAYAIMAVSFPTDEVGYAVSAGKVIRVVVK